MRVQRHRDHGHGLARELDVALFRPHARRDDDLDVALTRRLFDGIGHEADLFAGIGGGQGDRDGLFRVAGVDQGNVVGQGLGIHAAVEGGLAPDHDHGPALGRGFQMPRQPRHLERAVGGLPDVLAAKLLGCGQKILAGKSEGVDPRLGETVRGHKAQHVGRNPGPGPGRGRFDGRRGRGGRRAVLGPGHGTVEGHQQVTAVFRVHADARHPYGVRCGGRAGVLRSCRLSGRPSDQKDELPQRDAEKYGNEDILKACASSAGGLFVHAVLPSEYPYSCGVFFQPCGGQSLRLQNNSRLLPKSMHAKEVPCIASAPRF